jgi:hypothetical protein
MLNKLTKKTIVGLFVGVLLLLTNFYPSPINSIQSASADGLDPTPIIIVAEPDFDDCLHIPIINLPYHLIPECDDTNR